MSSLCVNSQMIYWDLANVKILNHSSFTINDLIRVVTLHAAVVASNSLMYLVGGRGALYDIYKFASLMACKLL